MILYEDLKVGNSYYQLCAFVVTVVTITDVNHSVSYVENGRSGVFVKQGGYKPSDKIHCLFDDKEQLRKEMINQVEKTISNLT